MPFGNKSLNAFPKVQAVNTMRDSFYYEELTGIKYDNLDNLGYPSPIARVRALRIAGDEILFIGNQGYGILTQGRDYVIILLFQVITSKVTLKISMSTTTSMMASPPAMNLRWDFDWAALCVWELPGRFG